MDHSFRLNSRILMGKTCSLRENLVSISVALCSGIILTILATWIHLSARFERLDTLPATTRKSIFDRAFWVPKWGAPRAIKCDVVVAEAIRSCPVDLVSRLASWFGWGRPSWCGRAPTISYNKAIMLEGDFSRVRVTFYLLINPFPSGGAPVRHRSGKG